ncbi:hypothetical protein ACHAWX_004898, partial [Stephanocyclus meneghinianus]
FHHSISIARAVQYDTIPNQPAVDCVAQLCEETMGDQSRESSKKRKRRKHNKDRTDAKEGGNDESSETGKIHEKQDDDGNSNAHIADNPPNEDVVNDNDEEKDDDYADDDADDDEPSKKRKRKRKRKNKATIVDSAVQPNNNNSNKDALPNNAKIDSTSHTVFIEGLPFTSTVEDVREFFEEHGCPDIVELRLPTWQDSGRLRGFGHVVFGSLKTKERALNVVNRKELGGRYVSVLEAKAPKAGTTGGSALGVSKVREQPEGCKTVFVRNLPYAATEEDILENFRVCGKILEGGVRIARNHSTGQSKGFGYVEYKNSEGAYAAVQKAAKPFGLKVLGRPVFVDYDEGSMKGSFRNKDGKLWTKEYGDRGGRGAGRSQK